MTLECTEARAAGATPTRYVTQKVLQLVFFQSSSEASQARLPVLVQACGDSVTRELRHAEPQEHVRAAGVEKV